MQCSLHFTLRVNMRSGSALTTPITNMSTYLPVEIIRAILLLALPPPGFNTWSARAHTLRSCSLVNSSWRIVAQDELFRNPVIQDSLDKCKVALKKRKWGEVSGKRNVRLIRLDMSLKKMEQLWEQWSGLGPFEVTIFHCSDVCLERLARIVGESRCFERFEPLKSSG